VATVRCGSLMLVITQHLNDLPDCDEVLAAALSRLIAAATRQPLPDMGFVASALAVVDYFSETRHTPSPHCFGAWWSPIKVDLGVVVRALQ
jgi:hypothetical protein